MHASVLADAGFLVALLDRRDQYHGWALAQVTGCPPPWLTCEAVVTESSYLLGLSSVAPLVALLRRGELQVSFDFNREQQAVLAFMEKYSDVPMSFADACLVRMSETHPDPVVLTVDADFRIYRRHSRQVVPCIFPQ